MALVGGRLYSRPTEEERALEHQGIVCAYGSAGLHDDDAVLCLYFRDDNEPETKDEAEAEAEEKSIGDSHRDPLALRFLIPLPSPISCFSFLPCLIC